MVKYRSVLCGVVSIAIVLSPTQADEKKLREMVEALPERLTQLLKENEKGFGGSTLAMTNASIAVGHGLIPAMVALVREEEWTEEDESRFVEEIKTNAQGVAADMSYSRQATGSGGTIVRIEAAVAYRTHIETRLCYHVTRRFESDNTFDLEKWHKRWADAGGSIGQAGDYSGENDPTLVDIEEGELRFVSGTSGGSYVSSTLATQSVRFSAKAGQKLSLATTIVNSRVEKMNEAGLYEAITKWRRAHDVELPKSKGGRYQIRFSDESEGNYIAPQLLIEIR